MCTPSVSLEVGSAGFGSGCGPVNIGVSHRDVQVGNLVGNDGAHHARRQEKYTSL